MVGIYISKVFEEHRNHENTPQMIEAVAMMRAWANELIVAILKHKVTKLYMQMILSGNQHATMGKKLNDVWGIGYYEPTEVHLHQGGSGGSCVALEIFLLGGHNFVTMKPFELLYVCGHVLVLRAILSIVLITCLVIFMFLGESKSSIKRTKNKCKTSRRRGHFQRTQDAIFDYIFGN
ncbi:hypothetical protein ACJX0J_036471 [Zea mays]